MKRAVYFVLIICTVLPFVGKTQNRYYFNEGDTIYGRDTIYHYEWWSDQWLASSPSNMIFLSYSLLAGDFHGRALQLNYTDQPLNVVGIATSFFLYYSWPPVYTPIENPPERQEYVLLYEADTSRLGFYEVGRIPIDYSKPARYMNIEQRGRWGDFCCNSIAPDSSSMIIIREYYFDKPITVRDSFYVGHTLYNNLWPDPEHTGPWMWGAVCWSYNFVTTTRRLNDCSPDAINCDTVPFQLYKFKQDDFMLPDGIDSSVWFYFRNPEWVIEFPIIEIDSSFYDGPPQYICPQVQNFRIAQAAEGTAVFLWDTHSDHQSWQISYGPAGTEPDDGTVINCPMQVGQIMGLDTCTDYVAYIRAVCDHDSIVYSEWSAPLAFSIRDTTGGGGTGGGTEAIDGTPGQYVQLFPNPASGQVQVLSSFELRNVEVFDLQGRTLLQSPSEGHSSAFSVDGWPSGVYVAIVRTSAGNFAKRIVVSKK